MPTGFTSAVAGGQITTLRDFALLCARGMGALISMRDEPLDAPLPDRLEPNLAYYGPELAKAQAALAELPGLSDEECERRSREEFDSNIAWRTKATEERAAEIARYEALLAEVEAWDCPAEGLREFMLQQLQESIRFDGSTDYMRGAPDAPLPGPEWRDAKLVELTRAVATLSDSVAAEYERTAARNDWLANLRASLPAPSVPA